MNKITLKLIRYFIYIMTLTVAVCFVFSSFFLSKYYLIEQYNSLQDSAKEIYSSLSKNDPIDDTSVNAILIKDNTATALTRSKMGMMPLLRAAQNNNFKSKGIIKTAMNTEFLYYKLKTDKGDIVVFKNNKYSTDYLRVVYVILLLIFTAAVILSIPLISFIGKKFTRPILKLQKVASSISKGNFDVDCIVDTNDEMEDLSKNINQMSIDLKKKYQLQKDFTANISHDFKTPLSVIRSYSEAIYDGLIDEDHIKEYTGEIIQEVDRLNVLVMDLLQLSKLQDGAYIINKEFISLQDIVCESINKFKPIINKKKIVINTSVEPVEIYADIKFLQRVLYNFLDNAVKFSFESSIIDVYTTRIKDGVKLSIKDYGEVIEQDLLNDIWNKYYKNSQSGGMGLGLPICKEILRLHGFEYGVKSSNEYGTEFYFNIHNNDIRAK